MIDGLWGLVFTAAGNTGGGVLNVREGRALGGDAGFTYIGNITKAGDSVRGRLEINQFNPAFLQLIPGLPRYGLDIEGDTDGKTFHLTGTIIGHPEAPVITITGVKQTAA